MREPLTFSCADGDNVVFKNRVTSWFYDVQARPLEGQYLKRGKRHVVGGKRPHHRKRS